MAWTSDHVQTNRLRLRPACDADKAALAEQLRSPQVRRHLGGPAPQERIDAFLGSTVGELWGSFVIADAASDECLGTVRLDRERGELEISYELQVSAWGRGIATEAVGAVIEWAWTNTDAPSIIAVTQTANERSCALLERLGFGFDHEFEEFGATQSFYRRNRIGDAPEMVVPIASSDGAEQQ